MKIPKNLVLCARKDTVTCQTFTVQASDRLNNIQSFHVQINLRNIVTYSSLVKTVILSQCALGVSVMSEKPEVYPKNFSGKNTFKKCNPPDFTGESYPSKLIKFSPIKVSC